MTLLSVEDALANLLSDVTPLGAETVPIAEAAGRVLAQDLQALRTQPPFAASAMDGYAVRHQDAETPGASLTLIGLSKAGARFEGQVGPGETVRIFTGAPMPKGSDAVLIQENALVDGNTIIAAEPVSQGLYVRPKGLDFTRDEILLTAGQTLSPRTVSLAGAMNHAQLPVRIKPNVALLATGDELVPPGGDPGPDQIVSSNTIGLAALIRQSGGKPLDLGIAADTIESICTHARGAEDAEVLVLTGGASVGDHDLVQAALESMGMVLDFWKIAMRPGKPLMVGRLGRTRILGLPGNPVSTLVVGAIFLKPLLNALLGTSRKPEYLQAQLSDDLPENDQRQDYLRARLEGPSGALRLHAFPRQDSSMLATLARSDVLIVRPPFAPRAKAGEWAPYIRLDD